MLIGDVQPARLHSENPCKGVLSHSPGLNAQHSTRGRGISHFQPRMGLRKRIPFVFYTQPLAGL